MLIFTRILCSVNSYYCPELENILLWKCFLFCTVHATILCLCIHCLCFASNKTNATLKKLTINYVNLKLVKKCYIFFQFNMLNHLVLANKISAITIIS